MKFKFTYIIAICCIVSLFSCEEQVLEKVPMDSFSEAAIFRDIELVKKLALQTYNSTPNWGINFNYNHLTRRSGIEPASDECYLHWIPDLYRINIGLMTPDDMGGAFKDMWWQKYEYIGQANEFLSKIGESGVKNEYPAAVEQLTGEMRYLRAALYADLITFWGGVPLIVKPFNLNDDFNVPRNSYKECVEFIVNELDEATEMVPLTRPNNEWGRVTKGVCLALKSRVLLYAASKIHDPGTEPNGPLYDYDKESKWQDAADAAKAVIDLNLYSLIEVDNWEEYQKMFLSPSSEIIFGRPYPSDYGNFNRDLNTLPDKAHSPNGYNGWATSTPTQNIVWDFKMANGKRIDEPDSGYDPNNPYEGRDPRFYANIVYNGCYYRGRNAEFFLPGGLDSRDGILPFHYNGTGYNIRKFMDESIDFDKTGSPNRPYIIFRLAEIYLNYAEAQYHLGNEDIAREYVNKVCNRVNMPNIETSGEQLLKDIKTEREIELIFEGHRFKDLRRWMDVSELEEDCMGIEWNKLNENGELSVNGTLVGTIIKVEERKFVPSAYYLPIPQSEIEKSNLQQNFGYN